MSLRQPLCINRDGASLGGVPCHPHALNTTSNHPSLLSDPWGSGAAAEMPGRDCWRKKIWPFGLPHLPQRRVTVSLAASQVAKNRENRLLKDITKILQLKLFHEDVIHFKKFIKGQRVFVYRLQFIW